MGSVNILTKLVNDHRSVISISAVRYGSGLYSTLDCGCTDVESAGGVIDCLTNGDVTWGFVSGIINDFPWYPLGYGGTTQEALDDLNRIINIWVKEEDIDVYVKACRYLKNALEDGDEETFTPLEKYRKDYHKLVLDMGL